MIRWRFKKEFNKVDYNTLVILSTNKKIALHNCIHGREELSFIKERLMDFLRISNHHTLGKAEFYYGRIKEDLLYD